MLLNWRSLAALFAVLSMACASRAPESRPEAAASARVPAEPYYEHEVDVPARFLQRAAPTYPDSLRRQGVRGTVQMEFVVDTLGRAEAPSIRLLRGGTLPAGAELLAATAGQSILAMVYSPARRRGRPVRQIVQMVFEFR